MSAIFIDTETTGLKEPEVIELAVTEKLLNPNFFSSISVQRFKPSKPIEVGALATHHILDEDLKDCAPWAGFRLADDVEYIVGHGVDYDWEAIGKPHVKRICTLALARHFWPGLGSHKLGACFYHIYADSPSIARNKLRGAHNAAVDVHICGELLNHILRHEAGGKFDHWESVWKLSEHARVPTVMTFGKHKGMAIVDLPWDYRAWILKQPDVDPYVLQAVRQAQQQAR